jgi:hypothetical protein
VKTNDGDEEMSKIEQKKKSSADRKIAKSLPERAREAEEQWRADRGLSQGLHRKGNAIAQERRRSAECPKEPRANVRYRRYCKKRLGKLGAASKVRVIDPVGAVI